MVEARGGYPWGRRQRQAEVSAEQLAQCGGLLRTLLQSEGNKPVSGTPSEPAEESLTVSVTQNHWYYGTFHIPVLVSIVPLHKPVYILFAHFVLFVFTFFFATTVTGSVFLPGVLSTIILSPIPL